ncbi:MAG: hypothetical protein FJ119_05330 [Deltaproteobacteria bacterium]|nr:hypothetical protein [Deltaproteobacteria bacterium]
MKKIINPDDLLLPYGFTTSTLEQIVGQYAKRWGAGLFRKAYTATRCVLVSNDLIDKLYPEDKKIRYRKDCLETVLAELIVKDVKDWSNHFFQRLTDCPDQQSKFLPMGLYVKNTVALNLPHEQLNKDEPAILIAPERCNAFAKKAVSKLNLALGDEEKFKTCFVMTYFHELAHRIMDYESMKHFDNHVSSSPNFVRHRRDYNETRDIDFAVRVIEGSLANLLASFVFESEEACFIDACMDQQPIEYSARNGWKFLLGNQKSKLRRAALVWSTRDYSALEFKKDDDPACRVFFEQGEQIENDFWEVIAIRLLQETVSKEIESFELDAHLVANPWKQTEYSNEDFKIDQNSKFSYSHEWGRKYTRKLNALESLSLYRYIKHVMWKIDEFSQEGMVNDDDFEKIKITFQGETKQWDYYPHIDENYSDPSKPDIDKLEGLFEILHGLIDRYKS